MPQSEMDGKDKTTNKSGDLMLLHLGLRHMVPFSWISRLGGVVKYDSPQESQVQVWLAVGMKVTESSDPLPALLVVVRAGVLRGWVVGRFFCLGNSMQSFRQILFPASSSLLTVPDSE